MPVKSIFLTGFVLLLHLSQAKAQNAQSKEALKSRMAANVCDCLTKKSATKKPADMSKAQIKQVFVECFGSTAGKEMKAIQVAYGQEAFTNKLLMRTLGEEVGAQLVQNCPEAMAYFMEIADDNKSNASAATPATTGQTVGQLGSLSGPGMTLLEIQTSKTEKVYFAWIRHFEQADELLAKLPDLRGKQARVSWQEVEVLQPDTRQYQRVREITGIELL